MYMRGFIYAAVAMMLASPAWAANKAKAVLIGNDGKPLGSVSLREAESGVLIRLTAERLKPGAHGVHFHSVGNCSDHEHFKAAAGHVTVSPDTEHGLLNPKGAHAGDLPNLYVGADGTVEAEFFTSSISLAGKEGKPALMDEDGSALMIHAEADDHLTQPIGGAGDRVACGVVMKAQ